MRWTGLKFHNIQSWEDSYVPLNPDGLTVITAPSETGKSVYIKCLRIALFFKDYHPDDRKAIVRNGHKEGYLSIFLEDRSEVKLIFKLTTFEVEYTDPQGNVSSWREFFPNEIKDKLGLVVNTDLQLILNLLDQESPMLFDGTSNEYNNEVLGFYANHEDLNHRHDVLEEWESVIDSSISNKKSLIKYVSEDMNRIPIIHDIDSLENSLDKCDSLNNSMKFLEDFVPQLDNAFNLKPACDFNCDCLRQVHSYYEYVYNLYDLLQTASRLEVNFTDASLTNCRNILGSLEIATLLVDLLGNTLVLNKPVTAASLDKLRNVLTSIELVNALKECINTTNSLDRPIAVNDISNYTNSFNELEYMSNLFNQLVDLKDSIDSVNSAKHDLDNSRKYVKDLRHEFKVCALCGSVLE